MHVQRMVGKNGQSLRIGVTGDIHLGHPNTTTPEILRSLYAMFPDTAETGELDLLVLEGDVFDRLLSLPDVNVVEVRIWINWLLRLCKKRDIVLRVLEGTPSHDRTQSVHFTVENETARIGADLEYVTTLRIEHLARFGIDVLYIPDEWRHEPDDTWKDVQQALADHGVQQVDFVVMHGAFKYQLPAQMADICHEPTRYLDITRYMVFVGHIHKHSVYYASAGSLPCIVASGSTDRLTHGEEEPKGHVRVSVAATGDFTLTFIENVLAKSYKTIDCSGLTVEEALDRLTAWCDLQQPDSYVRIAAGARDAILTGWDVLRVQYPQLNFSTKKTDVEQGHRETFNQILTPYTPAAITAGNVSELLLTRLRAKGVDPALLKRAEALLNGQLT